MTKQTGEERLSEREAPAMVASQASKVRGKYRYGRWADAVCTELAEFTSISDGKRAVAEGNNRAGALFKIWDW